MKKDRPVLIIDAYNLFTRHFCANPTLNKEGIPVGGAVGFLGSLRKIVDDIYPERIYVIWEAGGSPRRRALFPDYKKGRKPPKLNRFYDNDLHDLVENKNIQVSLLVEMLKNIPVCQVYVKDCEADDVIGYMAGYKLKEKKCVILSSDKDFYQLLSDRVVIYSPTSKKYVTAEDAQDRFMVSPENFCTIRSFCGDTSDNIPGIKGAGFKTMARRFPELCEPEHVSVEDIIKLSQQRVKAGKVKLFQRICENADIARRNWKLMHLGTSNLAASQIEKIDNSIDTYRPQRNKIGLMRILTREGLSTFDVNSLFFTLNFAL